MKKRIAALVFLLLVAGLVLGTLLVLRTPWAGERLCGLVAARVSAGTGLPLAVSGCRIDPFALAVEVDRAVLGDPAAPVFTADRLEAELAPVQALGGQLHLARLRLVRPRLALALEGGAAGDAVCPTTLLSRVEVRHLDIEDGAVAVTLPEGSRIAAAGIEVRSRPPARTLRSLAVPIRRAHLSVSAGPLAIEALGRRHAADRLEVEGELALDLSVAEIASATLVAGAARLAVDGRIQELCAPRLDVTARAEGPAAALLALADVELDAAGSAALEARVTGAPRAPTVRATLETRALRLGSFVAGDGEAELRLAGDVLTVDRAEVAAQGGTVIARGTVGLEPGVPLEAEVQAEGVDLAEVLDRLGVTGPWITVKLDGMGRIAGPLWPPRLAGVFTGGARDFKAITRSFKVGAGDPGILSFARAQVEAPLRVDRDGLYFDRARISAGRGAVEADAAVHFDEERGFWVRSRGVVDFDALGPLLEIPWGGRATIEASIAAAPYGNPTISGRARAEAFRFLDVALGSVATDFRYDDFLLRFTGAEGVFNRTRYRGEAVVDLSVLPSRIVSSRFEATGRIRDLLDAVADWLPRTRPLRDVVDGDVSVSGSASGPADRLDTEWQARAGAGTLLGRSFDSGSGSGRILAAETVVLDRVELRRGTGEVRVEGRYGAEPPFPWDLQVAFAGLPLAELRLPGGAWAGSASGTATLEGSFEVPRVRVAASGGGVAVGGVALGAVQAGGTLTDRRLVVTGGADAGDFAAEVRLEGRLPFTARATLALDDLTRIVPGGVPGLRARAAGEATAHGELEDLAGARGVLRLSGLHAAYADLRVDAAAPAVLTLERGRVELQPVTLRGPNTELTVGGARTAAGGLDVSASGAVDLRLLSGLVPAMRRPRGQLALEAHVGGTVEAPVLVGSGRIVDGGFQLRGTGVAFAGLRGALAFSQNQVLFDSLTADVNGGRARFDGEVELARFVPVRARIAADLMDVPVAIPAELPATLRGRVEAAGTPDAVLVSGRVHVVRARYTADVDLEGSLLELRRRPPPPPRAYDKAGEWIRLDLQVAVDGDVRVDNDLVRGPLSGELTVTGTLASPGLVGSLAMGEGSRLVFRGNEFDLTHAVLEFTDRHRIELALDVFGEAQVRDYDVVMHVFGSLARPEVTLTSVPPLSQPDIITLLSLGFTRRDAAAGTGVGGVATAAAAQALFSASGLDEQVRRFLPRGGPIRDLSMRVTSAYSEESGQVEPRAEFESLLLRDRLRLRFQAPLGGARGRKAQAELRLGARTALQYQWDNDNPDVATGDHGLDLKVRWEWTDR